MKKDLLEQAKTLVRIHLKDFPDEQIFARLVTLGERIEYESTRAAGKEFGQHEMLYLSIFTAEGRYYFDSPGEVAKMNAKLADELLIKMLEAAGVGKAAADDAAKKSESSQS